MLDDLELELRKLPGVRAVGFDDRGDVLLVQMHLATDAITTDEPPLPMAAARIATRHCDRPVAVEVVRWRDVPGEPRPLRRATDEPLPPPPPPPPVAPITPDVVDATKPEFDDVELDDVDVAPDEPRADAEPSTPYAPIASASGAAPAPTPFGTIAQQAAAAAEGADDQPLSERPRLLAVLSFPDTDELEVHLVLEGRRTIGRAAASKGLVAAVDATLEAIRGLDLGVSGTALWARPLDSDTEALLVATAVTLPDTPAPLFGLASGSSAIDAAARATLDALNRHLTRGGSA